VVTAEGHEVELACLLSSLEACGHGLDFSRCGGERFELRSDAHSCRDKTGNEWGTRLWVGLDVWATRQMLELRWDIPSWCLRWYIYQRKRREQGIVRALE
jgi:hypothetical protein